jgi:DNA-binding SARP family transcriptional activator
MQGRAADRWFTPSTRVPPHVWRFRVLGPLSVERDGVEVPVCPGKQRAFLVSLLLNVNHLVPVDMLMELLWDGEPPRSAVANIRTYASQLRTLVADQSLDRVMWRPPGYSFAAGDDELDLLAYKRRVEDGHHALAQGDTRTAVDRFGTALGMWRGTVAEDVERTNRLGSRLTALDEQRVTLVEDWMEARLQHGDHRAALNELRRLTGAHPLRERLWCQFMLASYRVGSSGPALQVFEEARRVLGDQLGVAPGPDLTRLHAGVLGHDPDLLVDVAPVDSTHVSGRSRPAPCELPPGVSALVGRDRELTTIRAAAVGDATQPARRNGPVIVAVHGPGGVGKSALAVRAAHDLRQHYPDGQIYVDLHAAGAGLPAEDPPAVLRRFLRTLDPGPEQPAVGSDEAGARFRSLTADRKMILVLDNAVDEAQVRPLLPSSADTLVLVTSRQMLAALDGPVHLELRPLSVDAARSLLGQSAGAARVEAEPEELGRLAHLCDRLPLALRVLGARLASQPDRPLSALSARLSEHRSRLDVLSYGDLTVRASLAVSYQRLTRGARLFRLLGAVRVPDVGTAVAAAIAGQATPVTEQALDELVDARLLERTAPGRYRMHDLVRLYAAELAAADDGTGPALHRAMSHYVKTARCAVASLRPGEHRSGPDNPGSAEALAWLEAERANMIEVSRQVHSAERELASWVPVLTETLYPYLAGHEQWDELSEWGELSRTVAARLKDQHAAAMAQRCLAVAARRHGRGADATKGAHQ